MDTRALNSGVEIIRVSNEANELQFQRLERLSSSQVIARVWQIISDNSIIMRLGSVEGRQIGKIRFAPKIGNKISYSERFFSGHVDLLVNKQYEEIRFDQVDEYLEGGKYTGIEKTWNTMLNEARLDRPFVNPTKHPQIGRHTKVLATNVVIIDSR